MPDTLKKLNDWADKWTERLYWKGYLLLTLLVVLGYISMSYVLTREVNILMALYLALGFPFSIMGYHARGSPRAGRVFYLTIGASAGSLAGIFLLFLIAILVRTATGMTVPAPTGILAFALGAVWGAMIGDRIGKRRGYVLAVAWIR